MLLQNIVDKSSEENLKVIKNTLPDKSGNPESLKNIMATVRKIFN